MMRVLHKSWGVKTELFKNDLCEVSVLALNKGQRCSWHKHRSKWNQFYVIDGEITIKTEEGSSVVRRGQVFTTNPLQWHEFQTPNSPAVVQEIMYVRYDTEDIERSSKGGPLPGPKCVHDWEDCTDPAASYFWAVCRKCREERKTPKPNKVASRMVNFTEVRKLGEDYLPTVDRRVGDA